MVDVSQGLAIAADKDARGELQGIGVTALVQADGVEQKTKLGQGRNKALAVLAGLFVGTSRERQAT